MASKRRKRARGCVGKRQYATLEEATANLGKRRGVGVYRCKRCGNCHIGHLPREAKMKFRKEEGL